MTDEPTPTLPTVPSPAGGYSPPSGMRWGLWDVATALLVFVMLLAGGTIVAISTPLRGPALANADLFNFVLSLVAYGGLVGMIVVASRRSGLRSLARDFGLRFRAIDLAIGLAVGIVARLLTVLLTGFAITVTGYTPERGNLVLSPEPLWIVLNGVVIAVLVAPFAEELFFRGLFLRSVRNKVLRSGHRTQPADAPTQKRAVVVAIAVSSLAFMALHLYQSTDWTFFIILGGSTLTLGVLNALVALRTGRLGGAIIAHIVFNGSAVLLGLVAAQS